ncbi:5-hydroxytryptamine receptor 1 [Ischnura elegans]|uniref:5-hydroxytryptamine receptor 1 n=1 Tax=Ischnura elegans TaxID=197161 RepID=UPI001ED89475|nr:5-hydroxytryptamine receptor 1 [Ischnura elegans]
MEHKATLLTPPPLHNSSCSHPRFSASASSSSSGAPGAGSAGGGGPGGAGDGAGVRPTTSVLDVAQAIFVLLLTAGVLGANLLLIIVINSRRYTKYIHAQPRYLLTSLASNDLAIGLLVIPFGFIPALYHCWPYGEVFCQIQALLRGALSQQSAVILICMAIDRYMCMLHPARYHRHSSKKVSLPGCVAVMSITWVTSLTLFAAMVLPRGGSGANSSSKDGSPNPAAIRGYYFNGTGLLACDPFFSRAALRILASCLLYFPTTMVLMYCYGSAFHATSLLRLRRRRGGWGGAAPGGVFEVSTAAAAAAVVPGAAAVGAPISTSSTSSVRGQNHHSPHANCNSSGAGGRCTAGAGESGSGGGGEVSSASAEALTPDSDGNSHVMNVEKMIAQERRLSTSASRTMAAMSLGFIVMVTPWTIQEVVAACTGSKVPPFVDFVATWLALSNSFWNPFLYWLLNNNFRRISRELLISKIPFRRWWRTHLRRRGVASLPADGYGPPRCCSGRQAVVLGGGHVGGVAGVVGGACAGGAAPGDTPESEAADALGVSIGSATKDPEEGEKHWGEILERTVSSNSLQALQRIYGVQHGPGRKLRYHNHRVPRPLPPTPKSPAEPDGETESQAGEESPAPATPLPPPPPPPPLPPLPLPHHYHHLGTCPHANLNNIHPMDL